MEEKINYDAFELAYAKGKIKKWTLEKLIIDTLYKTKAEDIIYIKTKDVNCFGKSDIENHKELVYRYGYLYRIPKTEVDLCVDKYSGKLTLKKIGIGFGYEDVEKEIFEDIYKQIKLKNIYYQGNFNNSELLIK